MTDGWRQRGTVLLRRYEELAAAHTRCTKHRNRKANLAILRTALEAAAAGAELEPRTRGLLQHAVDSMVRRLSELVVQAFPATVLPNPMIRELDALARAAGLDIPFVEELAADIFMGTFSSKFLRAAKLTAEVVGGGTVYKRYYGIDYNAVLAIDDLTAKHGRAARTSAAWMLEP